VAEELDHLWVGRRELEEGQAGFQMELLMARKCPIQPQLGRVLVYDLHEMPLRYRILSILHILFFHASFQVVLSGELIEITRLAYRF
jgi:hypothetical protein